MELAGLWKFSRSTGKGLGLEVNSLVDERRDTYKASQKAAEFLKSLYKTYGDWSLAIVAYNCGSDVVNNAIRRSGGGKKDYWEIYNYLPKETRGYVPAFIAAAYIMNYHNEHGISSARAKRPILTDTVWVKQRLNFKQISDVIDLEVDALETLNPQYRENIIPGSYNKPYVLILPSKQVYSYLMSENTITLHDAEEYALRKISEPRVIHSEQNDDVAVAQDTAKQSQNTVVSPAPKKQKRQYEPMPYPKKKRSSSYADRSSSKVKSDNNYTGSTYKTDKRRSRTSYSSTKKSSSAKAKSSKKNSKSKDLAKSSKSKSKDKAVSKSSKDKKKSSASKSSSKDKKKSKASKSSKDSKKKEDTRREVVIRKKSFSNSTPNKNILDDNASVTQNTQTTSADENAEPTAKQSQNTVETKESTKVKMGFLILESNPSGAEVFITQNGEERYEGNTPFQKKMPYGSYNYRIKKQHYHDEEGVVVLDNTRVIKKIELRSTFSQVTINTLPNAKIAINGEQRGVGSFVGELDEGIYDIEVSLAQHRSAKHQIEVVAKQPQTITLTLNPTPFYGSLDVISTPMYADIKINGKNYGTTPTTIENLLIGDYEVVLSKEGCATEIHRVSITENNLSTLETTLAQGREMTIRSDVYGAEVYVDGVKHGITPLKTGLSFGIHNIELRRSGKKVAKQVNVTTAGAKSEIKIGFGYLYPLWSSDATAEQKRILGKLFKDMVKVDGGTFTMGATPEQESDAFGNEYPTHRVTLDSYYIGKYEVTQEQWMVVMGNNPSSSKGTNKPVEWVSWNDCQKFIERLNQLTGLKFRLPTEAEWEYAARGGNKSKGYKYSGSNTISYVAWYNGNSEDETHKVGTKAPNELGLYDMSGNVWEWCSDWYDRFYYSSRPSTNPTGPTSGSNRVYRGGNWLNDAQFCRVSYRDRGDPGDRRYGGVGFRLVYDR